MLSLAQPDLVSLASLARSGDRELRPVLLILQARAFASRPHPDRRMMAEFEALALGLIPLVPDDVVADTVTILNGSSHVPAPVRAMLRERRQARSLSEPGRLAGSASWEDGNEPDFSGISLPDPDLALAGNGTILLDGHVLHALVGRAATNPALARTLLSRPEPSAFDRAVLYRFGDATDRERMRRDLERSLAVEAGRPPVLSPTRRERILGLADRRKLSGVLSELGKALKLAPAPAWRLEEAAEAELFALALVACGLTAEDCLRVILTVDEALSHSVCEVFRLAEICRNTAPAVARHLVGARSAQQAIRPAKSRPSSAPSAPRAKRAESSRAASASGPAPRTSSPRASAPAGRRSRSTTDPNRT